LHNTPSDIISRWCIFRFQPDLFAVFVVAEFISITRLVCISPRAAKGGIASLYISHVFNTTGNLHVLFRYYPQPRIIAAIPIFDAQSKLQRVAVIGRNFENSSSVACRVGFFKKITAFWVSSSKIFCTCYDFDYSYRYRNVTVEASNNGFDFSSDNVVFQFSRLPSLKF